MASVEQVVCLRSEHSGDISADVTRISIAYKVVFDAPDPANALACLTADDGTLAIPAIGDELSAGSGVFARSVRLTSVSDCGMVYTVSVEYSSPAANMGSLHVEGASEPESEIIDFDLLTGDAIQNSLKQRYIDPIYREINRRVWVAERTEVNSFAQILDLDDAYHEHINSQPFLGRPIGYWRLSISHQRVFEAGVWAWRIRYEFRGNARDGGWLLRTPDATFVEYDDSGAVTWLKDTAGTAMATPSKILEISPGVFDVPANQNFEMVWRQWNQYPLADFNDLGLPFV